MKSIKNLISIAAFLVGTYQAVCIVDGAALLNSGSGPLKLELRFMPPNSPAKDGAPILIFIHGGAWRSGAAKDWGSQSPLLLLHLEEASPELPEMAEEVQV